LCADGRSSDLLGEGTVLPEPWGSATLVGPAALSAPSSVGSVGRGDALFLASVSPRSSWLICRTTSARSSSMTGTKNRLRTPLHAARISRSTQRRLSIPAHPNTAQKRCKGQDGEGRHGSPSARRTAAVRDSPPRQPTLEANKESTRPHDGGAAQCAAVFICEDRMSVTRHIGGPPTTSSMCSQFACWTAKIPSPSTLVADVLRL
jgi:hypothetical protein